METTRHFILKLDDRHCSVQAAPPPYLWMAIAAAALLLLCFVVLVSRRKEEKAAVPDQRFDEYIPLKQDASVPEVVPEDEEAHIKGITANEHPKVGPRPAPSPASSQAPETETWMLKGKEHPKGQSKGYADEDAPAGQVGCTSTWHLTPGLPLTFHTPTDEVVTIYAVKKPLQLAYNHRQPIRISEKINGHGTELGIELGWTLSGIGYEDITQMPFEEANQILREKVGALPGAIPLKFKRNNGKILTTYVYGKPLGMTFDRRLPIKITAEEEGHHGQHIGIKKGWELVEINYIDIQHMTDFDEVAATLVRQVEHLPDVFSV